MLLADGVLYVLAPFSLLYEYLRLGYVFNMAVASTWVGSLCFRIIFRNITLCLTSLSFLNIEIDWRIENHRPRNKQKLLITGDAKTNILTMPGARTSVDISSFDEKEIQDQIQSYLL